MIALLLNDLEILPAVFGDDFYFSEEAARGAILGQSFFNVIHNESLIKVDFIVRKRDDYCLAEFERRRSIEVPFNGTDKIMREQRNERQSA